MSRKRLPSMACSTATSVWQTDMIRFPPFHILALLLVSIYLRHSGIIIARIHTYFKRENSLEDKNLGYGIGSVNFDRSATRMWPSSKPWMAVFLRVVIHTPSSITD